MTVTYLWILEKIIRLYFKTFSQYWHRQQHKITKRITPELYLGAWI